MRYLSLAVAILLLGCNSDPSEHPPPNTVWAQGTSFDPKDLTVPVNTEVTWEFRGGLHNVLFEDGIDNIGDHTTGTGTRTFGTTGTYRYRCTYHSSGFTTGMAGSVIVE